MEGFSIYKNPKDLEVILGDDFSFIIRSGMGSGYGKSLYFPSFESDRDGVAQIVHGILLWAYDESTGHRRTLTPARKRKISTDCLTEVHIETIVERIRHHGSVCTWELFVG